MAQITYENLFSESRNNVVSLISDKSNVSDPVTSSAEYRKWIYSRFPDVKSTEFSGYPFIVIRSTDLNTEIPNSSADGKSKFVNFDIDVEIYTSDTAYGDLSGKGLAHMEVISDDLAQTFMDMTNRNTLKSCGLAFSTIEPTDISEQELKQQKVYQRIFPLTFRNKMQVSA
jgi:hypothetical protein